MRCTSDDIRTEHEAALNALTQAQRRALDRLAKARRAATFNHRRTGENLAALFEVEAEQRNADLRAAA